MVSYAKINGGKASWEGLSLLINLASVLCLVETQCKRRSVETTEGSRTDRGSPAW
jgi:hypothetical protein